MEISLIAILGAVLAIGLRISGLMLFAPFFGNVAIPPRMKIVLVITITAALYPVFSQRLHIGPPAQWPLLIGREMVIGIGMGLATSAVFEGARVAGQVLSVQMGYSLVNILDPNTAVESTVVALFHETIAMFIFLALGIHHWILRAIANSFEYLPPGAAPINPMFTRTLLHEGAAILEVGIQLAAPVLAATLLIDVLLALLGKASPQMPLMLLGPAVKSMLGVLVLAAALNFWPRLFDRYFSQSIAYTEQVLRLAH
ncbi:MAG TPA: flagellar biosynthetic protein FliR [Terriglobales bacterium]|nr:flagellar biosynthetic protein FliR [Terriglobales bacterium]